MKSLYVRHVPLVVGLDPRKSSI